MRDIIWQSFLSSMAGGILSLDRTAAMQIMVSRPLVAAPVAGYIFGDVVTGLFIGLLLELLCIGGLPIGGHIPSHEIMLSVIITAVSIAGHKVLSSVNHAVFQWISVDAGVFIAAGFAILLILPMDIICRKVDAAARVLNVRFFNKVLADIDKGVFRGIGMNNLKGAAVFFILNTSLLFVLSLTGMVLAYMLLPLLPAAVSASLPLAVAAAFIVGFAYGYTILRSKRSMPVFLVATFFIITVVVVMSR